MAVSESTRSLLKANLRGLVQQSGVQRCLVLWGLLALAGACTSPAVVGGVPGDGGGGGDVEDSGVGFDGGQLDAGADADAGIQTCYSCHGSIDSPAPPRDVSGHTETTARGVGAHQRHLRISAGWHRDVQCDDCHVVPASASDATHIDTPPAEVDFGRVPNARGVTSRWDGTSCSTWCHGATLAGGLVSAPVWTVVDRTQVFCGSCHGLPPPPPHPTVSGALCGTCHPNASGMWFSDPSRHIDGVVDLNQGATATTARGVGAHQSHLTASSTWHRDVACSDCHTVPTHVEDPGHIDPSPAEVPFGDLAHAKGVTPSFDGTSCVTYCHGASMGGGQPLWTSTGTGQAACGTCHGLPPPPPHPPGTSCATCHPNAGPGNTFVEPQRHIDGTVDVVTACDSCHGSAGNPAPPTSTTGATSTTDRGVGAHRSHLGPKTWHAEVTCDECHIVPVTTSDPGHVGPLPAETTFGSLAQSGGAKPKWNGATCTNVYCHGATLDGGAGSNTAPTWTAVDGTQAACGTCHGLPPGGTHPQNSQCSVCHGAVIAADGGIINPSLHIDGLVQASGGPCGSCHALPPATGAHLVHARFAVPLYGGLGTAASLPAPTGYAFGCGTCHPLDGAKHLSGGRADIELSNVNAPAGSLKALSPNATYTPGSTVFTDADRLPYTLGTCGTVYCHSSPFFTTPAGVPTPGVDFVFGGYPIAFPAYPLTSSRGYVTASWGAGSSGCGACHGFPIRLASTDDAAMAGQSHSWIDAVTGAESGHGSNHGFAPLPCRTCHARTVSQANATARVGGLSVYGAVPITGFASHVNGQPDVFFDTNPVQYMTSKSLASATYSVATKTCSNVACHLAQTAVRSGNPYREQEGIECNACHQY